MIPDARLGQVQCGTLAVRGVCQRWTCFGRGETNDRKSYICFPLRAAGANEGCALHVTNRAGPHCPFGTTYHCPVSSDLAACGQRLVSCHRPAPLAV